MTTCGSRNNHGPRRASAGAREREGGSSEGLNPGAGHSREFYDNYESADPAEIVRSYGASLVLAPQAYEGMGGDEAASRILNAAHTIILHAVPEPEPLIRAAGTKIDVGSARAQHQYKVSSNEVRSLRPGACFVIGSGKAQKIQVAPTSTTGSPRQPPIGSEELPAPDPPVDIFKPPDDPLQL